MSSIRRDSPRDAGLPNNGLDPVEEIPVLRHSPAELVVNELDLDGLLRRGDEGCLRRPGPKSGHEALGLRARGRYDWTKANDIEDDKGLTRAPLTRAAFQAVYTAC